ncbi:MAG: hypothetical protein KDA86_21635 [Planctomycetaceae bacterium]|nr:hypothetical protein [Planctomycetaceae bacterium]MCA9091520.1 hypothetical protein [Planctomycetaceae bacterium]
MEEQRKLVQEAPDDLALQAQLGACVRTTGYLHQRRGEQPLAGEHYQEAFELFKANVAHLKDSASENLSVEQLHTALVELRASGLEAAPED